LRAWSVLALGRFFRLAVSAHPDHELVAGLAAGLLVLAGA
jgi:hypothetical protein